MALQLIVDSLEAIPEALKTEYTPKDGKFHLNVEGVEDTAGLKTALQKERKTASDLQKLTNAWKSLGKTPEEIQELLEAQQQREQTEAERKGEWDKLKAQMNAGHADALKAKDETIGQMRKRLEAELIDAKAVAAIAAAKGVPELLLPHVQRHVKVDDEFNVMVVDAKGDPRVNAKGEPLSIGDLVSEMRSNEIYGRAFEGSGNSGGGKQQNSNAGGSGKTMPKAQWDALPSIERAAFITSGGKFSDG